MQSDESRARSSKPDTIGLPRPPSPRADAAVLPTGRPLLPCRLPRRFVIDPTSAKWPISAVSLINILGADAAFNLRRVVLPVLRTTTTFVRSSSSLNAVTSDNSSSCPSRRRRRARTRACVHAGGQLSQIIESVAGALSCNRS